MPPTIGDDGGKRRKGQLSCAECRRLKLKCDRIFPCSSCRKRGCASICPNGVLTSGKVGGRFILANTEELHEKVSGLQSRVAELETALAEAHGKKSTDIHPLLQDELLSIKIPLGTELLPSSQPQPRHALDLQSEPRHGDAVLDALGTLTISEGGVQTFYGTTVGSEFLYEEADSDDDCWREDGRTKESHSELPPVIAHLGHTFPFSPTTGEVDATKMHLTSYLPSASAANYLCQAFYDCGGWLYCPIQSEAFYRTVFDPLFNLQYQLDVHPHHLAVLFSTLALGVLLDLNREPYHPEADHYYQLSRAALALESPLENTTIAAVQALVLMAFFNQMSNKRTGPAMAWSLNGLAVTLAQSVGLHRDWERWGLNADEVAIRRVTFWELTSFDSWTALGLGRPPSQAMQFVDCKIAPDPESRENPTLSFHPVKYAFSTIVLEVVNTIFSSTPPPYERILRLDHHIRDFDIPPLFQLEGINRDKRPLPSHAPVEAPVALKIQAHSLAFIREIMLLYLHRSFFARALSENPDDPFKSPYAASVLACHRSSCATIIVVRKLFDLAPRIAVRYWFFWVHSFTSSVVLASIVTKTPWSTMASSSMYHIDLALDLFQKASSGSRPNATLPILIKIREKAFASYTAYKSSQHGQPVSPKSSKQRSPRCGSDNVKDDLSPMLMGATRLVSSRKRPSSHSPAETVSSGASPSSLMGMDDVHPSLVEHLKSLGNLQPPYDPLQEIGLQTVIGNPDGQPPLFGSMHDAIAQHHPPSLFDEAYTRSDLVPSMAEGGFSSARRFEVSPGHFGTAASENSQTSTFSQLYEGRNYFLQKEQLAPQLFRPHNSGLSHHEPPIHPSHEKRTTRLEASHISRPQQIPVSHLQALQDESYIQGPAPPTIHQASQPAGYGGEGLGHSGGVYALEQGWRSFLSDIDMPFLPPLPGS